MDRALKCLVKTLVEAHPDETRISLSDGGYIDCPPKVMALLTDMARHYKTMEDAQVIGRAETASRL